jgi:hypothetical protein
VFPRCRPGFSCLTVNGAPGRRGQKPASKPEPSRFCGCEAGASWLPGSPANPRAGRLEAQVPSMLPLRGPATTPVIPIARGIIPIARGIAEHCLGLAFRRSLDLPRHLLGLRARRRGGDARPSGGRGRVRKAPICRPDLCQHGGHLSTLMSWPLRRGRVTSALTSALSTTPRSEMPLSVYRNGRR